MNSEQALNEKIFKAYDIRGIFPDEINENAAYRIGLGFARSGLLTAGKELVVGRDKRESSDSLFDAFAAGANAGGINVIDIGLCTTPMLYFAVNVLNAAGGAMITASHNPGQYNGFKLVREEAIPIGSDSGLARVNEEALLATRTGGRANGGTIRQEDILERYAAFFAQRFSITLASPTVIDTGNGTAGAILPQVLQDQKITHQPLFFEPDGRFPNHEANPLKEENLRHLREAMKEMPGSIGIAFDGDADRVCFLDESGEIVRGDLLVALLAPRFLSQHPGGKILYDLRSSRIVPEAILKAGGQPIKTRVGHAFIKHVMRNERALFGGELSYHFYFSEFFNCESGILAMLEVLNMVAESGRSLSELIDPLRKYSHSGEINFRVKSVKDALRTIERSFSDGSISHQDGLSVEYKDWWFNIRPSNTEPLLRLNLESDTATGMKVHVDQIKHLLKDHLKGD